MTVNFKTGTLICILCGLLLSGCSAGKPANFQSAGKLIYEKKTTTIEFSWWGTDERHRDYLEGMEKFSKLYPDIQVNCSYGVWDGFERRNRIAMASKTAPDVMLVNYSWLDEYSADGNGYYDLGKLADYIDLSQFSEEDLSYGTRGGKLNAIPLAYNTTIFIYNKSLYDKYGLHIPETWDDLFAAADIMKKDGIYPIGMVKKHFFISMVAHCEQVKGKQLFTSGGGTDIDRDDIKDMLEFYKSLVDEKVLLPVGQFESNSFLNGQSAGIACWINDGIKYEKYLDGGGDEIECGNFITIDKKDFRGWYKKPATLYAISSRTEHPEESAKLMDYLLNNEDFARIQGIEKGFPVSAKADRAVREYSNISEFALEAHDLVTSPKYNLEIMPSQIENMDIIDAFIKGADKYLYGEADIESCTAEIMEVLREI